MRSTTKSISGRRISGRFCPVSPPPSTTPADYAILPTWKLAQTAAQGLKVILSGEGGDEIFAGYGRYRSVLRPWFLGGRTIRHRGNFQGLDVLRENSTAWRDGIATTEAVSHAQGRSRLQAAQAVDAADWLSNDLLTKLDRCLMAHGLEGRTPFLDPIVAEAAFRLPDNLKIRKGLGKYALRLWLQNVMPEAEPFSKKRGFTVPVGDWIASESGRLGGLIEEQEAIQRICKPGRAKDLFTAGGKHKGFAAWILLFFALWAKHHIEGVDIRQASVFDALAQR
jgi:asparagine synthase (glutamine-hydrolysing)